MLIKIGSSNEPEREDIVSLLTACHDRIRFFIDLAVRLASATDASPDEIRDAAARVIRYFSESLPLHVADEEESIIPRLSGRNPSLDATLDTMHREHSEHEPHLHVLLDTCRALVDSPQRLVNLSETLRASASHLAHDFKAHLEAEERTVLPAIRSLLTIEEQEEIVSELRRRRGTS
jgi:hemerythrin-like domain-containing protein